MLLKAVAIPLVLWLRKVGVDPKTVRVTLSFADTDASHDAESALRQEWTAVEYGAVSQQSLALMGRRQYTICGIRFIFTRRNDTELSKA